MTGGRCQAADNTKADTDVTERQSVVSHQKRWRPCGNAVDGKNTEANGCKKEPICARPAQIGPRFAPCGIRIAAGARHITPRFFKKKPYSGRDWHTAEPYGNDCPAPADYLPKRATYNQSRHGAHRGPNADQCESRSTAV